MIVGEGCGEGRIYSKPHTYGEYGYCGGGGEGYTNYLEEGTVEGVCKERSKKQSRFCGALTLTTLTPLTIPLDARRGE